MATQMSPEERRLRAQLAAETSWAKTRDRTARTAAATRATVERFYKDARELHPDAPEQVVAKAAENLKRAYYRGLALKAATARRRRRESTNAA